MSFAELESKYPADSELRGIIARRRESKTGLQCMPPVVVLASMFAEKGADEVRELMSSLTGSGLEIDPERDFFPQIPPEFQGPMRLNHALIVFGVSVASIHETLTNKEFNAPVWCERYNAAVVGTQIPHAYTEGKGVEQLSDEDWGNMCRQARQDSSFASFFIIHFHLLPEALRGAIENSGALPFIQDTILPLYKERAQFLK